MVQINPLRVNDIFLDQDYVNMTPVNQNKKNKMFFFFVFFDSCFPNKHTHTKKKHEIVFSDWCVFCLFCNMLNDYWDKLPDNLKKLPK